MQMQYEILLQNQVVGQACLTRQGLYYHFTCRCRFPENDVYRIYVTNREKTEDLGICIPSGDGFMLEKRIPVKRLGEGKFRFWATPKHKPETGTFVTVLEDKPFVNLANLQNAKLQIRGGQTGVIFTDRSQDQQDSDRIP